MSFDGTRRNPARHCISSSDFGSSFHRKNNSNYTIDAHDFTKNNHDFSRKNRECYYGINIAETDTVPSFKRRKSAASAWKDSSRQYQQLNTINNAPSTSSSAYPFHTRPDMHVIKVPEYKQEQAKLEDVVAFMSRDEIERCSPSRKDGIDLLRETHLRYSYCAFLQNLGMRLELPQTTIGTAMVLCHRFFVRRSHACHDRFLIATAALFLAAKSEETPRPLNSVLKTSYEICHKQDLAFFPYLLPVDWFEQYRERVLKAKQMILTT